MHQNFTEALRKIKYFITDHSLILSVGIFLFLLSGLFLTVYQVSQQQEARSRAEAGIIPHVNCSMSQDQASLDTDEKKLFSLVNQYRKDNGLEPLVNEEVLNRAAAWLVKDMADTNKFSHTDSLGRSPGKRVVDCGYTGQEGQVQENIAEGQSTPQEVFEAWKKSSAHNATMLDESLIYGGVGRRLKTNTKPQRGKDCTNKDKKCTVTFDTYYWVMDFSEAEDTTELPPCEDDALIQAKKSKNAKKDDKKGSGGNKKNSKDDKKDNKKKDNKKKKNDKNKQDGSTDGSEDQTGNDETLDDGLGDTRDCIPAEDNGDTTGSEDINGEDITDETDQDSTDDDASKEDENSSDDENEEVVEVTEPEAPSLQFAVNIPGSEDLGDTRDLIVDFTDLNNKVVATKTVPVENFEGNTYIGYLVYDGIPSGIYKIRVKLNNSLRQALKPEFQKIDVTQDIDLPEATLVVGDFDNNNILNIADFNIFKNCIDVALFVEPTETSDEEAIDEESTDDEDAETFGGLVRVLTASCSQHDETDLNGDGIVDLLDYNILLNNFQSARGN